jgi:macrolide-specific efflux system membrane fusion protein
VEPTNSHKPPRRSRRRWIAAVALAALVAAGGWGWRLFSADAAVGYRTAPVAMGSIETLVTALGSAQPKDYVDVGAQVSGQLKTLHVGIGDRVAAGDLLAEIDPIVFEAKVRADRAQLANLNAQKDELDAQLALAVLTADRAQNLFDRKIGTQGDLQIAQTDVLVAQAKIGQITAQIDQAQSTLDGDIANLGYAKIYAPMDGTVVSLEATEGQTLNANQSAPVILRIADLDTMTIEAQVAEADISRVTVGMPVRFTTLGLPDQPRGAVVRQIMPTPEIVNDVVLYDVLIDVDNTDGTLMTSMTTQVFFVVDAAHDVPVVPLAALTPAPEGDEHAYVARVLTASGPAARTVTVGLTDRSSAEIKAGLEVGDSVITGTDVETAAAGRSGFRGGLPF